ncbi:MAG: class F sortase [Dehalococcoidia bacterium]
MPLTRIRRLLAVLAGGALGVAAVSMLALVAPTAAPASAETEISTLAQLAAIAGEDPRADYGRLRIPAIGVDAAIGAHEVVDDAMPNPYGPGDISWYDFGTVWFGGAPGAGQNAVMSGHVNYNASVSYAGVRYRGAGVFARLGDLAPGDVVEVDRGGVTYRYMVSWSRLLADASNSSWGDVLSAFVPTDSLTLYTCDGAFNGATLSYSHRLVVRAERLEGAANRIPSAGRVTFGVSRTNHPVALAQAQTYPVEAIFAQHPQTGRWLVYRPGAPAFTNTLLGNLRVGSPVLIINADEPR